MRGQWPKLVCGKETDAESTMIVHCGSQEMRRWKQKRWNQGCPRRGAWFWRIGVGAPALLEDGSCLRSHKNSGTNKTKMTLHCGPWRPSLPTLEDVSFLKTHCLKVVHVQSHRLSLSSSHLLWPAVSRQLLCSVLGRIRSHYWLLPQEQTDMRTCLKGAAWTSLDDIINLLTFPLVERITLSNAVQSFSCSTCFN